MNDWNRQQHGDIFNPDALYYNNSYCCTFKIQINVTRNTENIGDTNGHILCM